jgi:ABC-type proline/glycine betaine transport system permease subunit
MRTVAILLLLAGAGFAIYGAMTPNNPPDLIVSGAILMVALPVCFGIGLLLLLISFLAPKRPERGRW